VAVLDTTAPTMKRMPDHAELAQRYFNCAEANVERADRAINNNDRSYHVATAQQYLTLAEKELVAAQRRKRVRRSGGSRKLKTPRR
jgi:hypothetical protein